ncbi:type II-A CRISPR-associated protein Csn2 [Veillonella sp. YH-vei2232]|uniref:Type II-A CRISPR-associated protein Csn2 n=1 Tax=Veillonella absiana TaxID=3079305 RepID=A0ABU3Z5Y1_9FIRM|nr:MULTISPECIES: type II-A CRISPR-associated protein Csn2 [unclassified Veillonella]MDV5063413.1 type II-A CRISPR-associated protein Csn2 [Veillonella sp. YH-vei2232]MDV5087319.1 type II-A CRISPR-associated protein Csn2 [Veillonella sp. YH-vei2233]
MKLSYGDSVITMDITDDKVSTLVIEDKRQFRHLLYDLVAQSNGEAGLWVLGEDGKCLNLEKQLYVIRDPLNTDINSREILTKLQNQLIKTGNDFMQEIFDINQKIQNFYYSLENEYPYDIIHKQELSVQELVKMGGFNFYIENTGELIDLVSYIEVVQEFINPNLFVLVNLHAVTNVDERGILFKTLIEKKFSVLCLESSVDRIEFDKNLEVRYILDKDFCLI